MATKDDNVKRLQELAVLLGRTADTSGSAAEIQQRVMEWEEEANDLDDGEHRTISNATSAGNEGENHLSGWVTVHVLKTIHIPALTMDGNKISDVVSKGMQVQVRESHLHELKAAGLVSAT